MIQGLLHSLAFYILLPFSQLYGLIMHFRNVLYDKNIGYFKSNYFSKVFTLSVGNLRVGGSGKTPHVEYLAEYFKEKVNLCMLSRGYGRASKGFISADDTSSPEVLGDEPFQIFQKFKPNVSVAVCDDRALAIHTLLIHKPTIQCILLDDAFQHRAIKPHLSIVLTEFQKPFFKDYLLPAGRLREYRSGIRRADAVVVTKCPDDIAYSIRYFEMKIRQYHHSPNVPIFFTGIRYMEPKSLLGNEPWHLPKACLAIAGIADPKLFYRHIEHDLKITDIQVKTYPDHYAYSKDEVKKCIAMAQKEGLTVILTEKDAVKWKSILQNTPIGAPVFYIPIAIKFFSKEEQTAFDNFIAKSYHDFTILRAKS